MRLTIFTVAASWMAMSALASAQTPTPDIYPVIDEHGVDLTDGSVQVSSPSITIGDPSAGGLSFAMTRYEDEWRGNYDGTILSDFSGSTITRTISIFGATETFSDDSYPWDTFENDQGSGSLYDFDSGTGVTTYTLNDGTVVSFSSSLGSGPYDVSVAELGHLSPSGSTFMVGLVTSIESATGELFEYHYTAVPITHSGGTPTHLSAIRLQSVTSNRGYQMHFSYTYDSTSFDQASGTYTADIEDWFTLDVVTGINNAYEYCSPTAYSCTSASYDWPSLTISYPGVSSPVASAIEFTDNAGQATRFSFDADDLLIGARYPGSSTDDVEYTYDLSDRVANVNYTAISGLDWDYTYAGVSGLWQETRITDADGEVRDYRFYDSGIHDGRLQWVEDETDIRTKFYYDAAGRLEYYVLHDGEITGTFEGNYIKYTYDSRGNVTETRFVPHHTSTLADIVTSATYPSTCSTAPDPDCNRPLTTTDPRGNVTDYVWNSTHGGLVSVTRPAPTSGADRPQTRYYYSTYYATWLNASSVLTTTSDGIILPSLTESCATGSGTSCSGAANETERAFGYGMSSGYANNLQRNVIYSRAGNYSGGGVQTQTSFYFTPYGDVEYVDGPLTGSVDYVRYFYDEVRRPIGVIGPDPDGAGGLQHQVSQVAYNAAGMPSVRHSGTTYAYTDAAFAAMTLAASSTTAYDDLNRPIRVSAHVPSGGGTQVLSQTEVTYNSVGRVHCTAQRMNPSNWTTPTDTTVPNACALDTTGAYGPDRITRRQYDAAGRLGSLTSGYASGSAITTTRQYDSQGRLGLVIDGAGNQTGYTYDGFSRLQAIFYANPSTTGLNVSDRDYFEYDAAGNMTATLARDNQVTWFTYDNLNRLTLRNVPGTFYDTSYQYDNFGRLTQISHPWYALGYSYDALSRVTEHDGYLGDLEYDYDVAGRRTAMRWDDGFEVEYTYNNAGWLTSIDEGISGGINLATYAYDSFGRMASLTRGNGVVTTYSHDATTLELTTIAHNLTGTADDVSYGFTYTPTGQIAGRSMDDVDYAFPDYSDGVTNYCNDNLNRFTGLPDPDCSNLDTPTPTYDGRGNMTMDEDGRVYAYDVYNRLDNTRPSSGAAIDDDYNYDPMGRMYTINTVGSTYRLMEYDGADLISEYSSLGNIEHRYVHGPGIDAPLVHYDCASASGGVLGCDTGFSRRWLVADERGSVIAETDGSGNALSINTYDEYGVPGAANSGRFGYAGRPYLYTPGLYDNRARVYNPRLGRFMQTDPIGQAGGLNIYLYASADPINRTDPWGLSDEDTPDRWECESEGPNNIVCTPVWVTTGPRQTDDRCDGYCLEGWELDEYLSAFDDRLTQSQIDGYFADRRQAEFDLARTRHAYIETQIIFLREAETLSHGHGGDGTRWAYRGRLLRAIIATSQVEADYNAAVEYYNARYGNRSNLRDDPVFLSEFGRRYQEAVVPYQ